MLAELSCIDWDIVCFSETRASASDNVLVDGHRLISHKGTAYGGVAILIHADLAAHIVSQEHFGDRVLAV